MTSKTIKNTPPTSAPHPQLSSITLPICYSVFREAVARKVRIPISRRHFPNRFLLQQAGNGLPFIHRRLLAFALRIRLTING